MVIARDRYLAEDAAERIVVGYEPLPRGGRCRSRPRGRAPRPRRRPRQRGGPHGAGARRRAWPRSLRRRTSASPRPADRALRVDAVGGPRRAGSLGYRSRVDCGSGRRPRPPPDCARPSRPSCSLDLADVERASPRTSAAGSASRSMHPWPEEVLVAVGARSCSTGRSSSPRTAESISSRQRARARASCTTSEVGFDDDGRTARAVDVRFWHDNGAYIPYGLIVPIVTSTQLLGPYKPGVVPGRVRQRCTPTP